MKNEALNPAKSVAALGLIALGVAAVACGSSEQPPEPHRLTAQELCTNPLAVSASVRPVTSFGAVGDGVTDDYAALAAAARWLASQPATPQPALVFPAGTYRIDRVHSATESPSDACTRGSPCFAEPIVWRNLQGARIQGCGEARIQLKADFRQTADRWIVDDWYAPAMTTVDPFVFEGGVGFVLDGIEIDGRMNETLRDAEVHPDLSGGVGIRTRGAENYVLSNLIVHHMQSDGIVIGDAAPRHPNEGDAPVRPDRDFMIAHVLSRQNGRQPLTVLAAQRGVFGAIELEGSGALVTPPVCR